METKSSTNVGGLQFEWDLTEGRFSFEGQDAVLFWTSTAMKQFFDSLEEVSGEEAARVVLETTGFRQGLVVGEYFNNLKDVSVAKAANLITNTYASAGWGLVEIVDLNVQDQTLEVLLKNSWEHKINLAQGKIMGSDFLPAHFAGIFTGLFGCNIWYKVEHYQIEGMDETVISYFPSEKNVEENIHKLARQKEEEKIMELEKQVEDKTAELKQVIKDISSPIIPVLEGIVVIPLLGTYDEARAEELLEKTLQNLPTHRAECAVLDFTGINSNFTEQTASLIERIGASASLRGTETILVGLSPKVSMSIIKSRMDLSTFNCFQTLEHGIHFALAQKGKRIV